jgi:hypothetical protein
MNWRGVVVGPQRPTMSLIATSKYFFWRIERQSSNIIIKLTNYHYSLVPIYYSFNESEGGAKLEMLFLLLY